MLSRPVRYVTVAAGLEGPQVWKGPVMEAEGIMLEVNSCPWRNRDATHCDVAIGLAEDNSLTLDSRPEAANALKFIQDFINGASRLADFIGARNHKRRCVTLAKCFFAIGGSSCNRPPGTSELTITDYLEWQEDYIYDFEGTWYGEQVVVRIMKFDGPALEGPSKAAGELIPVEEWPGCIEAVITLAQGVIPKRWRDSAHYAVVVRMRCDRFDECGMVAIL